MSLLGLFGSLFKTVRQRLSEIDVEILALEGLRETPLENRQPRLADADIDWKIRRLQRQREFLT
jgi:hypothetical protein